MDEDEVAGEAGRADEAAAGAEDPRAAGAARPAGSDRGLAGKPTARRCDARRRWPRWTLRARRRLTTSSNSAPTNPPRARVTAADPPPSPPRRRSRRPRRPAGFDPSHGSRDPLRRLRRGPRPAFRTRRGTQGPPPRLLRRPQVPGVPRASLPPRQRRALRILQTHPPSWPTASLALNLGNAVLIAVLGGPPPKTCAFLLPVIAHLGAPEGRRPRFTRRAAVRGGHGADAGLAILIHHGLGVSRLTSPEDGAAQSGRRVRRRGRQGAASRARQGSGHPRRHPGSAARFCRSRRRVARGVEVRWCWTRRTGCQGLRAADSKPRAPRDVRKKHARRR